VFDDLEGSIGANASLTALHVRAKPGTQFKKKRFMRWFTDAAPDRSHERPLRKLWERVCTNGDEIEPIFNYVPLLNF
jgi:hypothetical protein